MKLIQHVCMAMCLCLCTRVMYAVNRIGEAFIKILYRDESENYDQGNLHTAMRRRCHNKN